MANWSTTTKHEPSSINNGRRYELRDRVSIEQLNNMTENSFYAMEVSSVAKEKAEEALEHAVSSGSRVLENGQFVAEFNADKKVNTSDLEENYYTKDQIYSKEEVDDKLANLEVDIDFSDYYTKSQTDNLLENKANKTEIPDVSNFITKAVSDLENYYTKSETYTRSEIDQKISAIPKFSIKVVTSLPTTDISTTTVYLVASGSESQNLYTEYIYVNGVWEKLGEQKLDLSNYPTIEEMNTAIADNLANYYTSEQINDLLSTLRSEIPSKTSDLTNDGNGTEGSKYATIQQLALKKTVYTAYCGSEYSMGNTAIVNIDNFPYTTFDSIPNGTTLEIIFMNPYISGNVNTAVLNMNVNNTGTVRVLVTDGMSDGYYNPATMGGWEANDVLTFVKGRSWMLIAISGRLVIGNTDLNAIKSQYLKDALVTEDTLRIIKQDGSTVDFQGGGIDEQELPFMPVGSIFASAIPQTDARVHLLDGSTILQTGVYTEFATLIKTLISSGYNISCSEDDFNADVTATGNCGKFVIDDTAGTIRLPKITTFIQGLSDLTNIGSSLSAGLPNITGNIDWVVSWTGGAGGAFYNTANNNSASGSGQDVARNYAFDASRSNSIYGNSSTVQPRATQYPYYIVLASGYKSSQVVDFDNIMSEINNVRNEVSNKASKPTNTMLWSGNSSTSATIQDISNFDYILICGKTTRSDGYWTTALYPVSYILREFNDGYEFRLIAFGGSASANYEMGILLTNKTSLTTYYTNLTWMQVLGIKF